MNVRSLIFILLYFARHLRSSNAEQRIIGGEDTDITKAPYMLSLRKCGGHICGAAILSNYWVVTAAHCLFGNDVKDITLCSGSSVLYGNCTVHNVTKAFIHESYNPIVTDYDIGLIKVIPPFTYNNNTKAVDLPNGCTSKETSGLVCGWGYNSEHNNIVNETLSLNLKCAEVPRISNSKCKKYYENRYLVTRRMTCYGFREGGIDSCQGDSGGPIVNSNTLLGITSWGDGCAEKDSPGVYTNICTFLSWIKIQTGIGS